MEYEITSHRHAVAVLESQPEYTKLWKEVQQALTGISDEDIIQLHEEKYSNQKSISTALNTLIKESMDYMNDFKDPKDEQISNLESQVEALNTRINNHIVGDELIESAGDIESLGGIIEEQTEQQEQAALKAQADAEIGNSNDPNIYWEESNSRLLHKGSHSGLRGVGKYAKTNLKLPDGSNPFQGIDSKIKNAYSTDLVDAKNKESNGALVRKYSQWKTDIIARSSGKRQNNAIDMLNFCRSFTLSAYNTYT